MTRFRTFARGDIWPSYIVNAMQDFQKGLAWNFNLSIASSTSLQVVAGADDAQVTVAIQDLWRYITSTITHSHPGGSAGSYDVFVTAAANNVVSSPLPNTDNTNYAFALTILPSSTTPTIVPGTVDVYRKCGTCVWSGAAITSVATTIGIDTTSLVVKTPASSATNIIQPSVVGATPLVLKGAASQTADLFSVQSSSGSPLLTISAAGNAAVAGTLTVIGASTLAAGSFSGALTATGAGTGLAVTNNTTVGGTLGVTGASTLASLTATSGTFSTTLGVTGAATIGGTLGVTGTITAAGATGISVTNAATVGGTLGVTGVLTATGGITVPAAPAISSFRAAQTATNTVVQNFLLTADTNPSWSVLGSGLHSWGSGGGSAVDVSVGRSSAGTLGLTGALTISTTLSVTGNATLSGNTTVGGTLSVTGTATGPTATLGDNSTKLATTAFVTAAVAAVTGGTGGIAFLGNDPQTFTGANTFSKTGTALTVTNNASVNGTLTAATLALGNGGASAGAISGPVYSGSQIAANVVLQNKLVSTDANSTIAILGSGRIQFGAGGATALDMSLSRESSTLLSVRDAAASAYLSMKMLNLTLTGAGTTTGNFAVSGQLQALQAGTGLAVTANATIGGSLQVTGNLGLFNATPIAQKVGYGAQSAVGSKGVLSASSTLNNVIASLSSLITDLKAYGLIGA